MKIEIKLNDSVSAERRSKVSDLKLGNGFVFLIQFVHSSHHASNASLSLLQNHVSPLSLQIIKALCCVFSAVLL